MTTEASLYAPVGPSERVWRLQFEQIRTALTPWVFEVEPGEFSIDVDAPGPLVSMYSSLLQLGYAKGWV
jgi:hypothetical protein